MQCKSKKLNDLVKNLLNEAHKLSQLKQQEQELIVKTCKTFNETVASN